MLRKLLSLLTVPAALLLPLVVRAQPEAGNPPGSGAEAGNPPGGESGGLMNPLSGIDSLTDLLNAILEAVIELGTIVLVLALVWVGFLFVQAQGRAEKLKDARAALMWTVIGGLLLLGAQAISIAIEATVKGLGA